MSFANSSLTNQMAADEFSANKQFVQSTSQQIDNVAWTIGRTETVDYTAHYGQVTFAPNVINYTFEIKTGGSWQTIYNSTTGMILFNMPVKSYSLGNNYFSRIIPPNNGSFLQWNASAPVSQVFATQVVPMKDGSYARIVAVPTVRALNSTINGGTYYKFYFPSLVNGSNPYLSQSVTLTGMGLTNLNLTPSGANIQLRINATALAAPSTPPGFNSAFFNFDHTSETTIIPTGSLIEFYFGTVQVSIGMVG
ncbi:MAG: hypothetical protein ABSA75_04995 [Candidatus Bathyarchaeia archaeon]